MENRRERLPEAWGLGVRERCGWAAMEREL